MLGAFALAETPAWCTDATAEVLDAATHACRTGAGPAACDACERLVLPHLRSACGQATYAPTIEALEDEDDRLLDHRSVCDVLDGGGVLLSAPHPVFRPFDPRSEAAARLAAAEFCREVRSEGGSEDVHYDFDAAPPAVAQDLDVIVLNESRATCGSAAATHWWRFRHAAIAEDHTHTFVVRPEGLLAEGTLRSVTPDRLRLDLFEGPACRDRLPASQRIANGAAEISWTPGRNTEGEVCLRVKAADYAVWGGFRTTGRLDATPPVECPEADCGEAGCGEGRICCPRADCAGTDGCPGVCVDPARDPANCGGCCNRCYGGAGAVCCGGKCAEPEKLLGEDPRRTSFTHCCDGKPDELCAAEQTYGFGRFTVWEDFCMVDGELKKIDLAYDEVNCGSCGARCQRGGSAAEPGVWTWLALTTTTVGHATMYVLDHGRCAAAASACSRALTR